ncbi:hypothetical protein OS493_035821 [Desmophyllum pertusum]|uniref:Galaxin-like repeats domain-containing protein n=1 Tax=Desmophyllum pertusum TaxID=174260 RepID=A0A9X0CDT0_9CNID|nr:hypothetical protein OS493_035821 [Desmophyllum pertusum]
MLCLKSWDEAPAGHAEGIEVEQVTFTNGKPSNASMENHEDLDGYGTEDNSDSSEDIGDDENYPNKNEYESDEGEEEMSIDEPAETDRDENEDGNEEEEGNDDGEDDNVDGEEEKKKKKKTKTTSREKILAKITTRFRSRKRRATYRCGRTTYNSRFSMCCGSNVVSRSGIRPACCGTRGYDSRFSMCCGSKRSQQIGYPSRVLRDAWIRLKVLHVLWQ